jgi:hypothetical protein
MAGEPTRHVASVCRRLCPVNWRLWFGFERCPNGQGLGLRTGGTAGAAYCPIWLAYVRLEDPRCLSPITTVGRFDTVDEAQIATDEVRASR